MNARPDGQCWNHRIATWLSVLVFGVALQCGTTAANAQQHPANKTSQRPVAIKYLKDLEATWKSRIKASASVKDAEDQTSRLDAEFHELFLLIRDRCKDDREKRKIIDLLSEDDLPEFSDRAALALVGVLVFHPDRPNLVELLSQRRAPREWNIEYELTVRKKLQDGLLVLNDAFEVSRKPAVKRELAGALRRALAPLGVDSADDSEMVKMSRKWYLMHKDEYVVDRDYLDYVPTVTDGIPGPKSIPLFITKDEARKRKSKDVPAE